MSVPQITLWNDEVLYSRFMCVLNCCADLKFQRREVRHPPSPEWTPLDPHISSIHNSHNSQWHAHRHFQMLTVHRESNFIASGRFKLEGFVGQWPRGPPLLCWFQLPQAYFRNPFSYRLWRSKNPVLEAVKQNFFIDFHQGPTRTIWQGPRRPLHKWPLLESARF